MADVAVGVHPVHALGKAPKKAKAASKGEKKTKALATHPPVNEMVVAALKTLKERHGTSLQAVKKYIGANYQCDVAKLSTFIKKSLKSGVANGKLVQTKGTGASGSFKLKVNPKLVSVEKAKAKKKAIAGGAKKVTKKLVKKPAGANKPKKAGAKKAKPTAVRAVKRAGGVRKAPGATALKQKSTKHSKSVAKKPRTPKPKKATGIKKATVTKK
ncbi:histone H1A, sperm-like [Ochlerotatus camptorhynchus]|uniref:histone H1A, sperm-like n=1 Tax=Ochlerotatus camptorhynchus TaxID=644619 RepID=UPI0031DC89AC